MEDEMWKIFLMAIFPSMKHSLNYIITTEGLRRIKIMMVFLEKHQDYCRTKDKREELFRMMQNDDVSLEDFVERFVYNVQRSNHTDIGNDVLKIILLRGIREDYQDMINLLGKGYTSKDSYDNIVDLCQRYTRGSSRTCTKE